MDAEAPIRAAVRSSLCFGGLRALADVSFDACSGDVSSVIRRRKRDLVIPALLIDWNARIGRSAACCDAATKPGGVVPDTTAALPDDDGGVEEPDLGGHGAERGSVQTPKPYKRRKGLP